MAQKRILAIIPEILLPVDLSSADYLETDSSSAGSRKIKLQTLKTVLGLDNVSNTSDAAKPISSAVQTALDAKANTASLGTAAFVASSSFDTAGAATTAQAVAIAAAAADATSKADAAKVFAANRSNHTGTQNASTITGLAAVATTGAYNDLAGKPTLGTASAQNTTAFDAAGAAATAQATAISTAAADATSKADAAKAFAISRANHTGTQPANTITGLSTVATTGAYADLTGRPTIGTAASANSTAFATAAQGAKADTAVQPAGVSALIASDIAASAASTTAFAISRANHTGTQPANTITGLSTVATTGAYADLTGRPTLGTAAAVNSTTFATAAQGAKADTALQSGTAIANVSGLQAAIDAKANTSSLGSAAFTASSAYDVSGAAAAVQVTAALDATSKANAASAFAISRANHTGTQAANTITGLSTVATTGAYADLTGKPTLGGAAGLSVGTTAGTVAAGDDSRITTALSTANTALSAVSGKQNASVKLSTLSAASPGVLSINPAGNVTSLAIAAGELIYGGTTGNTISALPAGTTGHVLVSNGTSAPTWVSPTVISGTVNYADILGKPTLGTASAQNVEYFGTAAQGAKADTALQPGTAIANVSGLQAAIDAKVSVSSISPTNLSANASAVTETTVNGFVGKGAGLTDLNASSLSSGTVSDARLSSNVVLTTDARLSNARAPLAHTHTFTDITGTLDASRINTSTSARFVTDAQLASIAANTGDETTGTIKSKLGVAGVSTDGYLTSASFNTFTGKQNALGYTPENIANRQNSLNVIGDAQLKYPTVYGVNFDALKWTGNGKDIADPLQKPDVRTQLDVYSKGEVTTNIAALETLIAQKNGEGNSVVKVASTTSSFTNGLNLYNAYTAAKALTPNGYPLSATNRVTVLLPPGVYDSIVLNLDTDYIDIASQTGDPNSVRIQNSAIRHQASNATVSGITFVGSSYVPPASTFNPIHNFTFDSVAGTVSVDRALSVKGDGINTIPVLLRLKSGGSYPTGLTSNVYFLNTATNKLEDIRGTVVPFSTNGSGVYTTAVDGHVPVTVNVAGNSLGCVGHGLVTGDRILFNASNPPAPITTPLNNYSNPYTVDVIDADNFRISGVTLTTAGSGTILITASLVTQVSGLFHTNKVINCNISGGGPKFIWNYYENCTCNSYGFVTTGNDMLMCGVSVKNCTLDQSFGSAATTAISQILMYDARIERCVGATINALSSNGPMFSYSVGHGGRMIYMNRCSISYCNLGRFSLGYTDNTAGYVDLFRNRISYTDGGCGYAVSVRISGDSGNFAAFTNSKGFFGVAKTSTTNSIVQMLYTNINSCLGYDGNTTSNRAFGSATTSTSGTLVLMNYVNMTNCSANAASFGSARTVRIAASSFVNCVSGNNESFGHGLDVSIGSRVSFSQCRCENTGGSASAFSPRSGATRYVSAATYNNCSTTRDQISYPTYMFGNPIYGTVANCTNVSAPVIGAPSGTVNVVNSIFTLVGHGLSDLTPIRLSFVSGTNSMPNLGNYDLFAVNVTTDTFQLTTSLYLPTDAANIITHTASGNYTFVKPLVINTDCVSGTLTITAGKVGIIRNSMNSDYSIVNLG